MKLYTSGGPNPRVVELFLAEKGVAVERVAVDVAGGENRERPYLAKNPLGQLPTLELEDGACISQVLAICELIEERHPSPPLIGRTPAERAETRMWTRRIDLDLVAPMVIGFRGSEGLAFFGSRTRCLPEAAEGLKAMAQDSIAWLDGQMIGKPFVCGPRFTLADILLFVFLSFGERYNQPLEPGKRNIWRWYASMADRFGAS